VIYVVQSVTPEHPRSIMTQIQRRQRFIDAMNVMVVLVVLIADGVMSTRDVMNRTCL